MKLIKLLVIALICIIIDQGHKYYMIEIFDIAQISPVQVTGFFSLVMVWNKGISFGMFNGVETANYFFIIFSTLIVGFLIYLSEKSKNNVEQFAFSLIIGGALGNIIDRLNYGAVADFFDFHYANYHWPAFNFADSFIFCGAVLFIIYNLFLYEKS